jgi:hypothetical protein
VARSAANPLLRQYNPILLPMLGYYREISVLHPNFDAFLTPIFGYETALLVAPLNAQIV